MSLYLFLDLASVVVPLLFSFHKRLLFYRQWKFLFPSITITGVLFVAWDIIFTQKGVWGFNPHYVGQTYFFNLPLEELLFFICVPYASVFTYDALQKLLPDYSTRKYSKKYFTLVLAFILLLSGIFYRDKWYTCTSFLFASCTLFLGWVFTRDTLSYFYLTCIIILVPFFLMNGILTGSFLGKEVVWYNNAENLGIRILTIPVEDVFYGFALILCNIILVSAFKKISTKK